jgi:hypothetical protein
VRERKRIKMASDTYMHARIHTYIHTYIIYIYMPHVFIHVSMYAIPAHWCEIA